MMEHGNRCKMKSFRKIRYRDMMLVSILSCFILLVSCKDKGAVMKNLQIISNDSMFFSNPSSINQIGDPFILKGSDGKYYC